MVLPTLRPDKAGAVDDPAAWNAWVDRLEAAVGALDRELAGASSRPSTGATRPSTPRAAAPRTTASTQVEADDWDTAGCAAAFAALRGGGGLEAGEARRLQSALLHELALIDHARGWVQQYHLGALRNNNTRMRRHARARHRLRLHRRLRAGRVRSPASSTGSTRRTSLAKTILYNLNPARQRALRHDDRQLPGRHGAREDAVRLGLVVPRPAGRDGGADRRPLEPGPALALRRDGDRLAELPLLLRGTTTSGGSSATCSASDVRRGLLPDDRALLGRLVEDVSFFNAKAYLGIPLGRLGRDAGYRTV